MNNVNENIIFVYGNDKCHDGLSQTTVVVNGQRMNGCKETKRSEPKPDNIEEKCCEIFTPRQCKKRTDNTWGCYHRNYSKCGGLCVADQVYLRPKETTWLGGILTVAPSNRTETPSCVGTDCPPTSKNLDYKMIKLTTFLVIIPDADCSGCADSSLNCSMECFTYPCNDDGCVFVDEDEFCAENAAEDVCKYKFA